MRHDLEISQVTNYCTVKSQISVIGPCAMSLELLPLLWSGVFFIFFMAFRGVERLVFCCVFRSYYKIENSQPHSARFYHLSFYCMMVEP